MSPNTVIWILPKHQKMPKRWEELTTSTGSLRAHTMQDSNTYTKLLSSGQESNSTLSALSPTHNFQNTYSNVLVFCGSKTTHGTGGCNASSKAHLTSFVQTQTLAFRSNNFLSRSKRATQEMGLQIWRGGLLCCLQETDNMLFHALLGHPQSHYTWRASYAQKSSYMDN